MGVTRVALGDRTWLRRLGWATLRRQHRHRADRRRRATDRLRARLPDLAALHRQLVHPHGALDLHSAIEFGNRTLTFVLTAVAIATFVSAWQSGRRDLRRLALLARARACRPRRCSAAITVLTDLNPWVVAFHLLFSMGIISLAVLYLGGSTTRPPADVARPPPADGAGLGDVRRGLGGARPRHRGDRLGPARR